MSEHEMLQAVVEDLIDVVHHESKRLDKFGIPLEQAIGSLLEATQFATIASD